MISVMTYGSGVGSGVRVGEICFVDGEAVVAVAVATIAVPEAQADNAIIPSRRLNKKCFLMIDVDAVPHCSAAISFGLL